MYVQCTMWFYAKVLYRVLATDNVITGTLAGYQYFFYYQCTVDLVRTGIQSGFLLRILEPNTIVSKKCNQYGLVSLPNTVREKHTVCFTHYKKYVYWPIFTQYAFTVLYLTYILTCIHIAVYHCLMNRFMRREIINIKGTVKQVYLNTFFNIRSPTKLQVHVL